MKLLEKFLLILGYFKYPITYMLAPKCSRLLYVGLGDGMDAIRVGRRASELVGVDISPVMAKICKYNIKSKKPRVLEAGLPIIKEAIFRVLPARAKDISIIVAAGDFLPFRDNSFNFTTLIGLGSYTYARTLLCEALRVSPIAIISTKSWNFFPPFKIIRRK
jgi:ubiquinone/menaquinone biosynthesis C-methylase UbiE